MICDVCGDNRFEIIEKAKIALIESTNIETSEDEMKVIDNFLFRCWQMGWLDKYEKDLVEVVRCKDCKGYTPADETYGTCFAYKGVYGKIKPTDYCSYGERK